MARTKFWSRYLYQPTLRGGTSYGTWDLVATLQPGETLLRSIISQDTWLESNTTVAVDAGLTSAWGFIPGDSSTQPPYLPRDSFGQDAIRWLYIDQLIFDIAQISVVAGSSSYIARNSERNRYTDSHIQYTVSGTTPKYLWLCQQFDPAILANASVISSAAVSCLILGPP